MAMIIMNNITADLTEEEIAELEAAEKMPISYDEDCPKMTEAQLRQFKQGRRVSIPVSESDMDKIKEREIMIDFDRFHKDDIVLIKYKVPKDAKGCPGPSGTAIMKIIDITNAIVWGAHLPISPYHPPNVRFYKKYITHMELYQNSQVN